MLFNDATMAIMMKAKNPIKKFRVLVVALEAARNSHVSKVYARSYVYILPYCIFCHLQ